MLIKERLDEYLEFDSNELFNFKDSLVRIFGGAIRDIIADMPINDIDILCGSKSLLKLESILLEKGYCFSEFLNGKDIESMYGELSVINEPHTWIKNNKIIQLIRPTFYSMSPPKASRYFKVHEKNYKEGFDNLISNVDISCCGVSWDGEKIHEDYENAILHCKNMVFSVNTYARMYNLKRINQRIIKLSNRGWSQIENSKQINRDLKINEILK